MISHERAKRTWKMIKGVSFVVLFTLILSAFSTLFLPESNSVFYDNIKSTVARGFYGEPKNSLDVIAVGNSNIESGFSPMELWNQYGITGYTCGEPFQNIFQANNILSEVLTCQKPKVVILETDGVFPLNDRTDTLYQSLDSRLNHMFPIFEYHNLWKIMFSGNTAAVSSDQSNPSRGYLYSRADLPFSGRRPNQRYGPVMDQICSSALDGFDNLCRKNHIQLVLVYVPTAYSWNQERHDWMENYAVRHSLPFLDLNTSVSDFQIDWRKDTRDGGTHLNLSGAKRVTLYLGSYLHQHYDLPDHRKDLAFRQWNEDYKRYLKMTTPKPTVHLSNPPGKRLIAGSPSAR